MKGFYYIENCIKKNNQDRILKKILKSQLVPISNSKNSRQVIHYGYNYDYKNRNITSTTSIPKLYNNLLKIYFKKINKTLNLKLNPKDFNQLIINRYLKGQGISAHTDLNLFGNTIVVFSVGGNCQMKFTRKGYDPIIVNVKKGSCYIMSGECRKLWKHEMITHKENDPRYSLTFRIYNP